MRRVVVTGMGMVTPLGVGVTHNWDRILRGDSGIRAIEHFDVSDLPAKIAGMVPSKTGPYGCADEAGLFDEDAYLSSKERRRIGKFILYGIAAVDEALAQSGWKAESEEDKIRTGVMIGSGIGGLKEIADNALILEERGPKKISPFFIPSALINLVSGHVSIRYDFKGPNHAVVTACSTGAHAIGDAARLIMFGDADVMVAGGAEAAVTRLGMAGFSAARALSTAYNETPAKASRPWDAGRDGFVMGEGAGAIVLEELEHAKKRGAPILAELTGYGLSGDAYHITSPREDGDGAYRAMAMALKHGAIQPTQLDYMNAHGTSTPVGDGVELTAIRRLMGAHLDHVSISSTKSATGHLLGAAGAIEAIYTAKAIETGILPPTLNLENPCEEAAGLDLVPLKAKEKKVRAALSNSFGFGGTNASLLFEAYEG